MSNTNSTARVAFNIEDAATTTATSPQTIALAIRDRELPAYRIDGQAIMLPADLTAWILTHPRF